MCVCLNNYSNFGYLITTLSIEGALWLACQHEYENVHNKTFNPLPTTTTILSIHYPQLQKYLQCITTNNYKNTCNALLPTTTTTFFAITTMMEVLMNRNSPLICFFVEMKFSSNLKKKLLVESISSSLKSEKHESQYGISFPWQILILLGIFVLTLFCQLKPVAVFTCSVVLHKTNIQNDILADIWKSETKITEDCCMLSKMLYISL